MSQENEVIEVDVTEPQDLKKDDIEVEKVEQPKEEIRVESTPSKKEIEPEEGLEALKAKLDEERQARMRAEARAREADSRAHQASNEVQDVNLQLVRSAIDTLQSNSRTLKSQYAEAMSVGDYDRAAEIQESMSSNSAKILQLEQGRTALESQPKRSAPEPVQEADPVERLASSLTPRSAEWIRRNPDFARNPRLYQKMVAAHNLVVADDVIPDTDDYFAKVESVLGINSSYEGESNMSQASKPVSRRSPPAAPVSRSGTGTGNRPNVVRLTPQEREMASMMGMTDKEYAIQKVALQKEGKLN